MGDTVHERAVSNQTMFAINLYQYVQFTEMSSRNTVQQHGFAFQVSQESCGVKATIQPLVSLRHGPGTASHLHLCSLYRQAMYPVKKLYTHLMQQFC